ncbi:hypothetical protein A2769_03140 [Candidatus Daviesbacteria bacterium RIFCSPHIGHO2_01_FULL_37_27]|nr:MAG: hypothetical protein A2769_03140 [Candidatus Daviesbacteria bacterium RIFCSPHIGHO2_01_FULL_37_27]
MTHEQYLDDPSIKPDVTPISYWQLIWKKERQIYHIPDIGKAMFVGMHLGFPPMIPITLTLAMKYEVLPTITQGIRQFTKKN